MLDFFNYCFLSPRLFTVTKHCLSKIKVCLRFLINRSNAKYYSQLTLIARSEIEEWIEAKPNQKGNLPNLMCPLKSWNPLNPCIKDSYHFKYISNFMALSDISFCILSIKELKTNRRCAEIFIYPLHVSKLSKANYL